MNFEKIEIADVLIVKKKPFIDQRGSFSRTFCEMEFNQNGFNGIMVQTNLSISKEKYTLRGMHMQIGEHAEDKLIQCIKGSIYDVIVDLREESATYGKYFAIELNESNDTMLFVPKGFAHGFLTLEDDTRVLYQVSNFYTPLAEKGFRWNDPFFNIQWPVNNPILSDKDSSWLNYKSYR